MYVYLFEQKWPVEQFFIFKPPKLQSRNLLFVKVSLLLKRVHYIPDCRWANEVHMLLRYLVDIRAYPPLSGEWGSQKPDSSSPTIGPKFNCGSTVKTHCQLLHCFVLCSPLYTDCYQHHLSSLCVSDPFSFCFRIFRLNTYPYCSSRYVLSEVNPCYSFRRI